MTKPVPIQHQIHTVLLTASKQQGVALGNDANGHAIKVVLLTPRAVELGLEKLRTVAHACGGPYATPRRNKLRAERVRRLDIPSREWLLR